MGTFEKMEKRRNEMETISKIVERADKLNLLCYDRISLMMDLDIANKKFNLRLNELLIADDFNFSHDIIGIQNNIDRTTKTFMNCFIPRFAGRSIEAERTEQNEPEPDICD